MSEVLQFFKKSVQKEQFTTYYITGKIGISREKSSSFYLFPGNPKSPGNSQPKKSVIFTIHPTTCIHFLVFVPDRELMLFFLQIKPYLL